MFFTFPALILNGLFEIVFIIFGSTIKLKDLKESKLLSFKIVGEDEADAKLEKISFLSPLARTLIGKYQGDDIKVEIPSGSKRYKIISVEYI